MKRAGRVKPVRSKPRPGRLKGEALKKLREDCHDRDKGRCQECGRLTLFYADPIADISYHMAHKRNKRMHGDSLEQVRTLCGGCHRASHNAGGKPVPPKDVAISKGENDGN